MLTLWDNIVQTVKDNNVDTCRANIVETFRNKGSTDVVERKIKICGLLWCFVTI